MRLEQQFKLSYDRRSRLVKAKQTKATIRMHVCVCILQHLFFVFNWKCFKVLLTFLKIPASFFFFFDGDKETVNNMPQVFYGLYFTPDVLMLFRADAGTAFDSRQRYCAIAMRRFQSFIPASRG